MLRENVKDRSFILIANDSEEDSFFIERALRQSSRVHVIGSVRKSDEAVAHLSGRGVYADRQLWPFPNILLMDFSSVSQRSEVMEWLQKNPQPGLKVVVASGSPMENEIRRVKALGGNAFLAHTPEYGQLMELVPRLEKFLMSA